jgi:hypothetical protein
MINVPAWAMKSARDYSVPYIRPEHVGDPEFEHGTYRTMIELYLRPHGARQMVLSRITYDDERKETGRKVMESPFLFPPFAWTRCGEAVMSGERWRPAALSVHFEELVRAHAVELCINTSRLDALHGGLRFHVVRLLYGTYWAPRRLTDASAMLHHVRVDTTIRLYCGKSSQRVALEAGQAERKGWGATPTRDEQELKDLHQQLAATKALCRELEGRAVVAEARAAWADKLLKGGTDAAPSVAGGSRAA